MLLPSDSKKAEQKALAELLVSYKGQVTKCPVGVTLGMSKKKYIKRQPAPAAK